MKLNIQRLAGGGVFYSSTVDPYAQSAPELLTQSNTKTTSESLSLPISDSVLKSLMEHGLISDFRVLSKKMEQAQHELDTRGKLRSSTVKDLWEGINSVLANKNAYDKSLTQAMQNGSLGEVAVDNRGNLFYLTKEGLLEKVHMSKYDANKQTPLTYGELALLRETTFANRNDVHTALANSVGIEKISSYIWNIVKAVGETESTSEAYTNLAGLVLSAKLQAPSIPQLLALLQLSGIAQLVGTDAIFKTKSFQSIPNKEATAKYLYNMLPQNMINLLQARYIVNNGKTATISDIIDLALESGTTSKNTFETTYDATVNKAAGTQSGSELGSKENTRRETTLELFFNGHLNREIVNLTDPRYKNRYQLSLPGTVVSSLLTDKGEGIGAMPLDLALDYSGKGMGKYLDLNNIWFGTDKVSQADLGNILYTQAQIGNVWVPTRGGEIDWESIGNYQAAEEYIRQLNITDIAAKNNIHRQYNSPGQYNSNGEFQYNGEVSLYLMTHGFTIDDSISADNMFYRELKGNEESLMEDKIKTIFKLYKHPLMLDRWDFDIDHIVEIPIFIKIQPNASTNAAYYAGLGDRVPEMTIQQDMLLLAAALSLLQINADANALYN